METKAETVPSADELTKRTRNPYPYFAELRAQAGVQLGTVMDYSQAPEVRPVHNYVALSFDAVNKVFRDGKTFNSTAYDSTIGLFTGPSILAMGGAAHRAHRKLVSAAFTSKSLARWGPDVVRPIVNDLIAEFVDAGETDLVKNFTFEFPTRVIATLLGLPREDLATFRRLAVELISYTVDYELAFQSSAALKDYFLIQMERRKSHPTNDIIGNLVTAEIDGKKLTDEAIYSFLRLLLPAGLETTYRSSGSLLYLLLSHPEQFAALRADPELVDPAIEEGLRYETPLTTVQRFTSAPTTLEGVDIPAEAVIDVCMGSANRDETQWERPEEFDITRKRIPHIAFAAGEHTCLGLHLARLETRVALECLIDRLSGIELLDVGDPHIHGQPFRSPNVLPVKFTPAH